MDNLKLTEDELKFVGSIIERIDKGEVKELGNELLRDFQRGLTKEVMAKGCRLGDVLNEADMAPAVNRLLAEENKTPLHRVCIGYALSQEGRRRTEAPS